MSVVASVVINSLHLNGIRRLLVTADELDFEVEIAGGVGCVADHQLQQLSIT